MTPYPLTLTVEYETAGTDVGFYPDQPHGFALIRIGSAEVHREPLFGGTARAGRTARHWRLPPLSGCREPAIRRQSDRPQAAFLTEAEAATMARAEIVERLYDQSEWWKAHQPKSDRDREAYDVHVRIMHASIDPGAGMDAVIDHIEGRPNDFREATP